MIASLANLEDLAQQTTTMIPLQVLTDIDLGKNPMQVTRDRLERAATENQFMNGKIAAIDVSHLGSVLCDVLLLNPPTVVSKLFG